MGPFVQVVLGQIISLFGNAALRFVLPLILLRQTGSAAVYGAATALALLPALAGTLAGGVLADRCRKARLMVVLDLAAAGLALGAAASADNLPTVLWAPAALCALYALQGLYQPVVRASLPLLLAGDRLVQGNAVIQLVDTLDELLGPLLGSALLGVMGLGPALPLPLCWSGRSASPATGRSHARKENRILRQTCGRALLICTTVGRNCCGWRASWRW